MNSENGSPLKKNGQESLIDFSEQGTEKTTVGSVEEVQKKAMEEESLKETKKKSFQGIRDFCSPMPGYDVLSPMKDFWKTAFVDSFAMIKTRRPLDSAVPFQTVLDNWGLSSENINKSIRVMDLWVLLFSVIEIFAVFLFIWGTQTNKPFLFCLQIFMVLLIPPIPLAVTLWKRDVLRTETPQSFLHWFRHGFLGVAGILLCIFWFAVPIGNSVAAGEEGVSSFVAVPELKVTNPEDLSSQLLFKLFGEPWKEHTIYVNKPDGDVSPDVSGVFLALFGGLNTVALTFVSVFLVYIYGAGAVNGSQMGKWTDDQVFSSFWSPVRSSFAVAFCAPLPSGLSLMQGLVMVAIAMSVNFANDVKSKVDVAIENTMITNIEAVGIMERYDVFSDVFSFALHSAMIVYADKINKPFFDYKPKENPKEKGGKEGNPESKGSVVYIENKTGYVLPNTPILTVDWGEYLMKTPKGGTQKSSLGAKKREIGERTILESITLYGEIFTALETKNFAFFDEKTFMDFYLKKQNEYTKDVSIILDRMKDQIKSTASQKDIFAKIKEYGNYGWVTIGTYTFSLANAQGAITESLNTAGTSVTVTPIENSEVLAAANAVIINDIPFFKNIEAAYAGISAQRAERTNAASSIRSISGLLGYASNFLEEAGLGPVGFAEALKRTNPVNVLTSYGSSLISAMAIALTALGIFSGLGTLLSSSPAFPGMGLLGSAVGSALSVWTPLITFAIGGIMSFAAACTYILPAIPLIFWMRALFTWLILCIETLVGAPFWAATHALPEGKGFAGQHARRGYLMLLDVMIRPTLLVVGATISLLVICVVGFFMGTLFQMWAEVTIISFNFSFVGILVMTIILMYITYETCVYVFVTAVGHMPEQVIRWAGGQSGSSGTREALDQIRSAGGKTSGAGQSMISGMGKAPQK